MIRWFAAHPTASNLLLTLILAMGAFAAPTLIRETFPEYLPPEVGITMKYRGASAADVEEAICRRLGTVLQRVDDMKEFRCTARDNQASAVASMGTRGNMSRFLDDIRTELDALTNLPAQAEKPVIRELYRTSLVAAVAVSGPMSFTDLEAYASALETRLFRIDGVADVITRGVSQRQWQVEVSRDLLRQYGLGVKDIANTIGLQNLDSPLGTLETKDRDVQLRFTDQRRSPAALLALSILGGPAGAELTLGDVATVTETYESKENRITFNGEPSIILEVHKNRHKDALRVFEDLQTLVAEERIRSDRTLALNVTQDMTSIVRQRLQMLVTNGIMGLALVGLLLSLFFRPRLALWPLFGLPAAFAGAFVVMALTGLSLNMITLVALLMAIGLVMDDSVVIADNIVAEAASGKSALDAAVDGTRSILPGVLSSFLTTAAVFVPLAFLAGELGSVMEVLPVVLVAALAASLIQALWVLPHHLRYGLTAGGDSKTSRLRQAFDRGFELVKEGVGLVADAAIRVRYGVLAGMLLFLLVSIGVMAGGYIRMEAMPEIDGDVLEARILMPQGTPLVGTEAVARRVARAMTQLNTELAPAQPNGEPLVESIQVRFSQNASANETGAHTATVIVDLLSAEQRTINLNELSNRWYEAIGPIAGILSLNIQQPGFGPAGIPIEIRLQGEDLDALKQVANELTAQLAGYRGVFNVLDDLRPGKPQRVLRLAKGALPLGITAREVASQVQTGLLGRIVDTIQIGDQHIEILVRATEDERATLDFLDRSVITGPGGVSIPLSQVATIAEQQSWAQVTRIDGRRTITVTADVDAGTTNTDAVVDDLRRGFFPALQQRYPQVDLSVEGQTARSQETGQSIARGLLLGLLGIFLILSFQFRNYREPIIVMLSIPVAFMGAVWGHIIMGYNLSMPSLIGAASLAGIVVNNAILLVQFINEYRSQGLNAVKAAGQASRARFRAIFITTSTTVAGMLPLLAETSTQAMAVMPLVISIVFGLVVSTILILLVLPALYAILEDLETRKSRRANAIP